jgi:hypothetical protein
VAGNWIGLIADGNARLKNGLYGVFISEAGGNTIGGTASGAGNVISGNDAFGVFISGTAASGNVLLGNRIGTNVDGTLSVENKSTGVNIKDAPNNTIGGTAPGAGNQISGNRTYGLRISSSGATGNVVSGNLIGTDVTGNAPLENRKDGLFIFGAGGNTIGGTEAGAGNVISGNGGFGVSIAGGGPASGNMILGNRIGASTAGTAAVGNASAGVNIKNAPGNIIGGAAPGAGNQISGNGSYGVRIAFSVAKDNVVEGNMIGTDQSGAGNLGNGSSGVRIQDASRNRVGGTADGAGNVIAFNNHRGVEVSGAAATRNAIRKNSIFSNAALGIDLIPNGLTPNDVDDADSGANNRQNFPEIASVVLDSGQLEITYTVPSSVDNSDFPLIVEFYLADADGEEGQTLLGQQGYAAPDQVLVSVAAQGTGAGDTIVATATDAKGNTSEFSLGATVTAPLLAAGGEAGQETSVKSQELEESTLQPIVGAALARLSATGLSAEQLAALSSVSFAIADLPGAQLGLAGGNTITLDINAAGYGWYIDPTPYDDSEFSVQQSAVSGQRSMDLLTVIYHEMGHAIGLDDDYSDPDSEDIMNGWLPTGVRRIPSAEVLDGIFANQGALDVLFQ